MFNETDLINLIKKMWRHSKNTCPGCNEPLATDFHKNDCLLATIVGDKTKSCYK